MDPVSCRTTECIPCFSGVSRTNTKRSYNETYIRGDSEFDSRAGNRTSRLHTKEECTMLENLIVDPEFEEKIPRLSEEEFQLLEQLVITL